MGNTWPFSLQPSPVRGKWYIKVHFNWDVSNRADQAEVATMASEVPLSLLDGDSCLLGSADVISAGESQNPRGSIQALYHHADILKRSIISWATSYENHLT